MTEIFSEWLNEVNRKMKRANRKILLFVDNVTNHVDLNLSNVAVRFLPPNMTNEVQPLAKGIIQSMKLQYRKQLMRAVINAADKCNSVAEFTQGVTVLDAIRWVNGVWENVSLETIKKFFRHSGFMVSSSEEVDEEGEEDNLDDEINCLPEEYRSQIPDIRATF
jgi:uncharacterized protein YeeX (DUF496 family)